jgi:hypothetical protein
MPLRSISLVAASLLAGASSAFPSPASAADPQLSCPAAQVPAQPEKKKRKGLGVGGLLGAMQRSGVGSLIGTESLGNGKIGQIAGVAGAVARGADPASAAGELTGRSRAGALVSATVRSATELVRTAKPNCPDADVQTASDAAQEFRPTR